MTKAVLFDVDGTLIDTVDLHAKAWVEALQHFGIRSTFEDMRLQIAKGLSPNNRVSLWAVVA